ncbi:MULTISPECIES: hypothetical protein [Haloferacaceae]|uniref:Uncharacterized protein n=1 Tax=Halorubrum glutamatedens TaxID=2707018 RepID=A0ABD5QTI8_9EURY|nr:hypothetical protein [Halobellus captivus]
MFGSRDGQDVMVRDDEGLPAVSVTITPIGSDNEDVAGEVAALLKEQYATGGDQEGDDAE